MATEAKAKTTKSSAKAGANADTSKNLDRKSVV